MTKCLIDDDRPDDNEESVDVENSLDVENDDDEEFSEIEPYELLDMIVDDLENNIYELPEEVREDIEVVLDQLYSQHQVLQRVQAVFEQMTKKELRPILHFDRPLMDDLILAILCELRPDICPDCEAYTQRCFCILDEDEEEDDLNSSQPLTAEDLTSNEDLEEGERVEEEDEHRDE